MAAPLRLLQRLRSFLRLTVFVCIGAGAVVRASAADRVTFFTEPNFKGEALAFEPGAAAPDLSQFRRQNGFPWLGAISSVRIEGAAKATVFTATGFRGEQLEIAASIADLYGEPRASLPGATWDRCIASISAGGPRTGMPGPPTVVGAAPAEVVVVTPAPPRAPVAAPRPAWTPRTADAFTRRAYRDVLGRDPDPAGLRHYRELLVRGGWSDRDVYRDLQRSAEARAINPDAAIAQAYHDVLRREPDAAGLAHYRQLWREGWTQGQIRDDLRRSAEARDASIRNAVVRAYREVLGREPDASGLATYERRMREQGWSEAQVRTALRQSEEYRATHGGR